MRVACACWIATVSCVAIWTSPVRAAPARVVVAPVQVDGGVPAADREVWQNAVTEAAGGSFQIVNTTSTCSDAGCWAATASELEANAIVATKVEAATNDYAITMQILDHGGTEVERMQLTCEICTPADVAARIVEAGPDLAAALDNVEAAPVQAGTSITRITSRPAGADVIIDGARVGTTPFEGEVKPGSHQLELRLKGHSTHEEQFEAVGGMRASFSVTLRPPGRKATAAAPGARGSRAMWIAGLSLLGVGVGAAAGGAVLVAIDSRPIERKCTGDSVDINGECEFLHDTITGGAVVLALGGAVLATGVALAVVARGHRRGGRRGRSARLRVAPSPGGLAVRF